MRETPRLVRFASGGSGDGDRPGLAERIAEYFTQPFDTRGPVPVAEGAPLTSDDIEEGNGADAEKPFGRD